MELGQMDNLLLTDEQILKIVDGHYQDDSWECAKSVGNSVSKAQDKKTREGIVKWLFEPCTEHPFDEYEIGKPMPTEPQVVVGDRITWLHRIDCPQCREELKG